MNTFKFRAECQGDAETLIDIFQSVISDFTFYDLHKDLPDVIGVFKSDKDLIFFQDQITHLLNSLDFHVILDTLELEQNYTGDRKYLTLLPETPEQFKYEINLIRFELKRTYKREREIIDQYINTCKPCEKDQFVSITLSSGRVVSGNAKSFGILSDGNVYLTSYKDGSKMKYITTPYQSIEIL